MQSETVQTGKTSWLRTILIGRNPRRTAVRLAVIVVGNILLWSYVLLPIRVDGPSMLPNYRERSVNVVNRLAYLLATYSAVLPEALAGALPVRLLLREAAARRDLRRAGRTGAGDVRPDARPFPGAHRQGRGRQQHEGQPRDLDRR